MSKNDYDDYMEWPKIPPSTASKRQHIKKNVLSSRKRTTSLLDLNVDCLIMIFRKLKMQDKIYLALSCQTLLKFYSVEIAPTHKIFTKEDVKGVSKISQAHQKCFLEATGHFIKEVDISCFELEIDTVVQLFRHGINITKVDMEGAFKGLPTLLAYGKSIEDLSASFANLSDYHIKQLQVMPNLRILRLNWNNALTGKHFASHTKLEELYLDYNDLKAEHIQAIAKCCPNLRILDASMFEMDAETSHVILENCHNLDTLCFLDSGADLSAVAKLPKLRRLALCAAKLPFLHVLLEHKGEQLEDLRVMGDITRNSLLQAIVQFKNLKIVRLQVGWNQYELENIDLLGESLKLLCKLQKLEKLLIVNSTNVQDDHLLGVLKGCPNLNYLSVQRCPLITGALVLGAIDLLKKRRAERRPQNKAYCTPFLLLADEGPLDFFFYRHKRLLDASTSILKLYVLPAFVFNTFFNFQKEFPYEKNKIN